MALGILVADDSPDIQGLVRAFLELEQDRWEITTASSGSEALDKFQPAFHFVLLDYMMPGPNGLDTGRALRERGYEGPVVIWSSAGVLVPYAEAEALDIRVLDKGEIAKLIEIIRAIAQREDAE